MADGGNWEKKESITEAEPNEKDIHSKKWIAALEQEADISDSNPRHSSGGHRRGQYRAAAPIGFVVLVLAIIGIITIVTSGVGAILRSQDNTELKNELFTFVKPLIRHQAGAFTDINAADQEIPLTAALWYLTNKERIRMDQNHTIISNYTADDMERWKIPVAEVETSFKRLFGPDAVLDHSSIGDESGPFSIEYNEEEEVYHSPLSAASSMYETIPDTLTKKKDEYLLRVCYVSHNKITIDDDGQPVEPTPDMADFSQIFTLRRVGENGWMVMSIADEGSMPSKTDEFQPTEFTESAETTESTLSTDVSQQTN